MLLGESFHENAIYRPIATRMPPTTRARDGELLGLLRYVQTHRERVQSRR